MTKNDCDFETWFDNLSMHVLDATGVEYRDQESVKKDYENGADLFDVVDAIGAEYLKPNLVVCVACNKEFDLNRAEEKTIVGETGISIPVEMEVDVQKCPHCGVEGCYD